MRIPHNSTFIKIGFQLFHPCIKQHFNYGRGGKFQIFDMLKILPRHYFRSNLMMHMQYDQFWAFIYHLAHSIGLFPAPDSIYEVKNFYMLKILSGHSIRPNQKIHKLPDQFRPLFSIQLFHPRPLILLMKRGIYICLEVLP